MASLFCFSCRNFCLRELEPETPSAPSTNTPFPLFLPLQPANLPPDPQPPDLLPLHLLPRDRQLSSQPFKTPLTQLREPPIQLLLPPALHLRHLPHDGVPAGAADCVGGDPDPVQGFRSREPDVAILVVVHVAFQGARQGGGGGVVEVGGAEPAVPEVGGGVFGGDEEDGDGCRGGGGGGGSDGVGRRRVMLGCVSREGFEDGLSI